MTVSPVTLADASRSPHAAGGGARPARAVLAATVVTAVLALSLLLSPAAAYAQPNAAAGVQQAQQQAAAVDEQVAELDVELDGLTGQLERAQRRAERSGEQAAGDRDAAERAASQWSSFQRFRMREQDLGFRGNLGSLLGASVPNDVERSDWVDGVLADMLTSQGHAPDRDAVLRRAERLWLSARLLEQADGDMTQVSLDDELWDDLADRTRSLWLTSTQLALSSQDRHTADRDTYEQLVVQRDRVAQRRSERVAERDRVLATVADDAAWLARGARLFPPVDPSFRVSSSFGMRTHPVHGGRRLHAGMDFAAPTGTPVRAADSGTVTFAGTRGGYGLLVIVDHGGGRETYYAHLSRISVQVGSAVDHRQQLGLVGMTGTATGPHLHFEVRDGGTPVEPSREIFGPSHRR